jgi:peptidoglycan/LPS O-acetylase OafA/YrhL
MQIMSTSPSVPCMPAKMESIEAARGLAAVMVALMHAANLMRVEHLSGHVGLGNVFGFGYVGVDFFFVLSGFIIAHVNSAEMGRAASVPRYLWCSFSRIYPIYWLILLLSMLLTTVGHLVAGKGLQWDMDLSDVATTVFLMPGVAELKYVGVAWSLCYEVVFYAVFCVLLLSVRAGTALFVAWAACVVAHALGWAGTALPFKLSDIQCLQFLFGMAVAALVQRYSLRVPSWMLPAAVMAFAPAVLLEVRGRWRPHSQPGAVLLGLGAAAIVLVLVGLERQKALRTPAWLVRMGSVSYSIYLGHIVFINTAYWALLKLHLYHALPETVVYGTGVAVGLGCTMLIGRCVELPLVQLLKDRWGPRPARSLLGVA